MFLLFLAALLVGCFASGLVVLPVLFVGGVFLGLGSAGHVNSGVEVIWVGDVALELTLVLTTSTGLWWLVWGR